MIELITQTISLLIIFFIGYGLKHVGLLKSSDGSGLFRLVFYVGAPALILTTLPTLVLSREVLWLAALPLLIIITTFTLLLVARRQRIVTLPKKTFGTLVTGAVIMNTGFLIPFVDQFYGVQGLAKLMVIDTVNAALTFSLVYFAVIKIAGDTPDWRYSLQKLFAAPPLWALLIALLLNATNAEIPGTLLPIVEFIARLVGPVILLGLGLQFSWKIVRPSITLLGLAARFLLGGIIGLSVVWLAGLDGLAAHIVVLAAMAPIGFNAIVFSDMEKLDTRFASSLVGASIVTAILLLPVLVFLLNGLFPI